MTEQEKKLKHLIVDMLPYLEDTDDEGPLGEGWKSPKLKGIINRAYEAIGSSERWR